MQPDARAFYICMRGASGRWFAGIPLTGYNASWRAPAHCGMVYLVRSGTKQPKPFTASAADQARLLLSLIDLRFQRAHRHLHQRIFLQHVVVELEPDMVLRVARVTLVAAGGLEDDDPDEGDRGRDARLAKQPRQHARQVHVPDPLDPEARFLLDDAARATHLGGHHVDDRPRVEQGGHLRRRHRAAAHDEPIVETKVYTSEAGGGMASLGELADFGSTSKTTSESEES